MLSWSIFKRIVHINKFLILTKNKNIMARKKEITQLDFWLSAAKNAELQLKFFNAQKKVYK